MYPNFTVYPLLIEVTCRIGKRGAGIEPADRCLNCISLDHLGEIEPPKGATLRSKYLRMVNNEIGQVKCTTRGISPWEPFYSFCFSSNRSIYVTALHLANLTNDILPCKCHPCQYYICTNKKAYPNVRLHIQVMVLAVGLEPTTFLLQGDCSAN